MWRVVFTRYVLVLLILSTPLFSNDIFSFQGDFLYFKPFFTNDVSESNGLFLFPLETSSKVKKNKFNHEPGYRLNAFYSLDSCYFDKIGARFTFLPSKHQKRILPSVQSQHTLDYYSSDVFLSCPIFDINCLAFSCEPGLHFAFMKYQNCLHIAQTSLTSLTEKSKTWGLGPELGLKVNYTFLDGFILKGALRGGILYSKAKVQYDTNPSINFGKNPKALNKFFPFWETSLSLSYPFCIGHFHSEIELGYEYLSYPDYIDRIAFSNASRLDTVFTSFDFQGPFISLKIRF